MLPPEPRPSSAPSTVATLVKRQNLVLSPLNIVMLTDGIPDTPSEHNDSLSKYKKINVSGLEFLSKNTTLPVAREIVGAYIRSDVKLPWYIDLLNSNLENGDLTEAKRRICLLAVAFRKDGTRITENLDFGAQRSKAQ